MKSQPMPNYQSSDDVQTPQVLARALVEHFERHFNSNRGILEPCAGNGNFVNALREYFLPKSVFYMDIKIPLDNNVEHDDGDFLTFNADGREHFNAIITNPPWSKIRPFMAKSFEVADNVVFLLTLNHALGLKARWNLCDQYNFGVREIVLLDTPPKATGWPQAGFQLGACWWQRECSGEMKLTDMRGKIDYTEAVR